MNFKKLAVVAALASVVAAPVFAKDYDVTANAKGSDVNGLAQTELATANVIASDGNVAFINQESASNSAYIDQQGATNFASVVQTGNDGSLAVVYQIGDNNRAVVYQHN